MPIVYTEISKPSAPTYTERTKPFEYKIDFLFQDGENYLFQDGVQKQFVALISDMYTTIARPSAPTYNEIVKPS